MMKKTSEVLLAMLGALGLLLKKAGIKLIKTPELQLATVLVLGLLFSGLIIFGMGRDNQRIDMTDNTPMVAYNITADQSQAQE